MEKAILLAVAASFCTATASIAQRQGAKNVRTSGGFDVGLIVRLAQRPVWLLGIASMILGFGFQLTALRFGALALVQPILALELLLVFGYMAFAGQRRVRIKRRDWLAAAAMSAGVAGFIALASPSGGRPHATGSAWLLAWRPRSALCWSLLPQPAGPVAVAPAVPARRHLAGPPRLAPPPGSPGASWPR